MKSSRGILRVVLVVALSVPAFAQSTFYLHTNDRVIFYGDSITEQYRYGAFIESYVLTRFPELNVRFINAGWSGDWVVGGGGGKIDERLARDVVANEPTVATFMVGMNDAGYQDYDPAFFDVYSKGYAHLLESLRQSLPGLRITLLQPSPFDDVTRPPQYALRDGGYNKVIVRYGEFVREFAHQQRVDVIDMNAPLVEVLENARLADPGLAEKIIPDRIHPSAEGSLVMAAAILQAWHAPAVVSTVEIDVSHAKVRQENTRVTELETGSAISWSERDGALPMPFDPKDGVLTLVLHSSNIEDSLDRQILRVTGLSAAKYDLKINGEEIGAWTKEALAQGVNLALLNTPMLQQALAVHAFSARRNVLRLTRWQNIQVGLQEEKSPHIAESLAALDAVDAELLQQQRAAAVPQAQHYELLPQSGK